VLNDVLSDLWQALGAGAEQRSVRDDGRVPEPVHTEHGDGAGPRHLHAAQVQHLVVRDRRHEREPGRAVQVQPMKSVLKAPGSMLLKLRPDGLLSFFSFEFNWRRYSLEEATSDDGTKVPYFLIKGAGVEAGAYARPLFGST